jgi:hypothetical protein
VFVDTGQPLRLPVGDYHQFHVTLAGSNLVAHSAQLDFSRAAYPIVRVASGASASLTAGGPLTNTVTVRRRGGSLQLSYRLIGADGRDYELDTGNRLAPPQFTVFHDGREVGSGTFEYG